MSSRGPIETLPLFPALSRRFVALLETLDKEDWQKPASPHWRVRDVVAHLVDGSLRRLSAQRDGHTDASAPADGNYDTLLAYLNRLNADWVAAMNRLSPRVLIDLVRWSDEQLFVHFSSLDPNGPAIWPVAWAGETQSHNWFDIAREYTEKWHHAQQVFEAAGRPSTISDRELMYPCIDTLMRGLPHGLRTCEAPPMTIVRVQVSGESGGEWMVIRDGRGWQLREPGPAQVGTTVSMRQDDAWRILMKRLPALEIRSRFRVQIAGNQALGDAVLESVCVMA